MLFIVARDLRAEDNVLAFLTFERIRAVVSLLEETKKSCFHRQALHRYSVSGT